MAFTDLPDRGAMLVMLDGTSQTSPRMTCPSCSRPMLRVFTTAGARRVNPSLPSHKDVCITTNRTTIDLGPFGKKDVPCTNALSSRGLIDQLLQATRDA